MKTVNRDTLTYPIVESFHSVQGEGAWTGTNAYFIRLGGCDVYCSWCDQKESWNARRYPQQSVGELVKQAKITNPTIVIVTGGEPLLHDLKPLTRQLKQYGLRTHLETSGTHPFSGFFDWVTFSPKRYKIPHQSIYPQVHELKVVVKDEDDLRWAEEQAVMVPETAVRYLQPEWDTLDSRQLVFDYVLSHPLWRVSLQCHKFLGVR